MDRRLFRSFFQAGFECSTHRIRSGKRLDILASSKHEHFAPQDYERLQQKNIRTARSGVRWHLVEPSAYRYDFSSVLPMVRAARKAGVQVIWDLFHFGWPDELDIFSPEFVKRFCAYAAAFARLLQSETEGTHFLTPTNEISYFAWAGGDNAIINPFAKGRGMELKQQLGRATIECIEAIWDVLPQARIVQPDPVIHILPNPHRPEDWESVRAHCEAQYETWDMISGRIWPWLGGQEKYLDIIGVNYYRDCQWMAYGDAIKRTDPRYKPFREMLTEVYERYRRPMFISETGDEDERRGPWLRYVSKEVRAALYRGVPIEGICLYPILNHPGWEDDRYCCNGLWDYADEAGAREICEPLAEELRYQQRIFHQFFDASRILKSRNSAEPFALAETKRTSSQLRSGDRAMNRTTNGDSRSSLPTGTTLCLFTDSMEPSGMGQQMLTLASELVSNYRVLFVCPPSTQGQRFLEEAAAIGCVPLALHVGGEADASAQLRYCLQEMDVEVFHCHAGIGWEGHTGIRIARASGVPVVVRTEHLPYLITDQRQRTEHLALLKMLDQLITVSEDAYRSFIQAGVPGDKLCVVRNGIRFTPAQPDRSAVRMQLGLPDEAKILLTVARMTEQKGHCYLLDAIPEIARHEPDAHFVWVGDGPLASDLQQQAEKLGEYRNRLHFVGRRNDVPQLLAASDLFVLPSLFEGLPIVALEAMASGVPVMGTRVCGTSEVVVDEQCGRLVEPANAGALADAIVDVLAQPEVLARWSHEGRRRVEKFFGARRMADEVLEVYCRLRYTPAATQKREKKRVKVSPTERETRMPFSAD